MRISDWSSDVCSSDLVITCIRFGGPIADSHPSWGLPADANEVLAWTQAKQTVLMVGTIEPRKGHEQALEAFEALWLEGRGPTSPQLLIVGQAGWKTDALQQRLITHPLRDKHVRWLDRKSTRLNSSH